jgi:integral membrane protein (TIGR01906 family)
MAFRRIAASQKAPDADTQKEKKERHPLLVALLVILVAPWLIGASFQVVLLGPVTSLLAERTVNDRLSTLDHARLVEVAEAGRAFVAGERSAALPEGREYRVAFPPDVVGHMEDVRSVIRGAQTAILILTLLLVIALAVVGRRAGHGAVGAGLFVGGIAAFVVVLLLALIGVFSFDALFTNMHRLFFTEGTWTFSEDSLLICAYPLPFWIGMGIVWAVALAFLSAFSAAVGFFLNHPSKKSRDRSVNRSRTGRNHFA